MQDMAFKGFEDKRKLASLQDLDFPVLHGRRAHAAGHVAGQDLDPYGPL
jgi:hypothetical protein